MRASLRSTRAPGGMQLGINALGIADLCTDVNKEVGTVVDPTKDAKDYWELPTQDVSGASHPAVPSVTVP